MSEPRTTHSSGSDLPALPRHDLVRSDTADRSPLDPKVLAQARRDRGCAAQAAWDTSSDAAAMLSALVLERGADPSILLPPAKFMATATRMLTDRGGQLDPMILHQTLRSVSRQIVRGKFADAMFYLRHAWGGIRRVQGTSDDLMADLIRELFPAAPAAPTTPTTRKR